MALWVLSGVMMLTGLLAAGRGLGALALRFRLWSGGARLLGGGMMAALGLSVGLVGVNLQTWHALTAEAPAARIEVAADGAAWTLRLTDLATGAVGTHALTGDEWRLEARLMRFHPWAAVLGLGPVWRLERLSGRWSDPVRAGLEPPSVHALAPRRGIELVELAKSPLAKRAAALDVEYGTGVFMPLADGAAWDVTMSRDGLIPRPANAAARKALESW